MMKLHKMVKKMYYANTLKTLHDVYLKKWFKG